jgi:ubiquinone/menaquinone biosynthesis C-methylase UbiE
VADAFELPFAGASFRLVLAFTLLSSIVDPSSRVRIADEIGRVLVPGGSVLVYDVRVPNPLNAQTRPIPLSELARLFAGCEVQSHPLTVVPQLSRWLPEFGYRALAALPFALTHRLTLLTRPVPDRPVP